MARSPRAANLTLDLPAGLRRHRSSARAKSTLISTLRHVPHWRRPSAARWRCGQPGRSGAAAPAGGVGRSRCVAVSRSLFDNLHNGHPDTGAAAISRAVSLADLSGSWRDSTEAWRAQLGEGGCYLAARGSAPASVVRCYPTAPGASRRTHCVGDADASTSCSGTASPGAGTTLLYVSHDISSTLSLPKVAGGRGRVVEAGPPAVLKGQRRRLCRHAARRETLRRDLWAGGEMASTWRYAKAKWWQASRQATGRAGSGEPAAEERADDFAR